MMSAPPAEPSPTAPLASLPPLPVLTDAEWRALPHSERSRLRQLKKLHRSAAAPAPTPRHPPGSRPEVANTPFRDFHGRSLWLDGLHQGASCFVVLSGPCALECDLSQLRRRGVWTLAVNNAGTIIRPNGWVFVDPPDKFHNAIWLDPGVLKFVQQRWFHRHLREKACSGEFKPLVRADGTQATIGDMPGVVGMVRNSFFAPDRFLTEPSINWGNSNGSARRNHLPHTLSVMFHALKIPFTLGFRVVYLVGCDFRMDAKRPYSFATEKDAGAAGSNNGSYEKIGMMLALLRPHFEAAGYHVFNTNANSGLTVFPHIPFSKAIEAASGHIPQDPLDTVDWYKK